MDEKTVAPLPDDLVWHEVKSKNLERAAYDAANQHVYTKFQKNPVIYRSLGCSPELFDEWKATFDKEPTEASTGGFHHRKIKPLPFEKILPVKKQEEK